MVDPVGLCQQILDPGTKEHRASKVKFKQLTGIHPSPLSSGASHWALCENLTKDRVVFAVINMAGANMAADTK
jgi:hypothetical protein